MKQLVDTLRITHHLNSSGYKALLDCSDEQALYLHNQAQQVATNRFGHGIYVRGLIELTNVCRNDCFYCGIRRSNTKIPRYTLSHEQALKSCEHGYELGFRTFVLQGGELPRNKAPWIVGLIEKIRNRWSDCAITLSLGEWPLEIFEQMRSAGADRYLLRHETHNACHYSLLHPTDMSLPARLKCLDNLKKLGYQVGSGIMVGSPGQTVDNIVEDIEYIERLEPQMIGLGPFVPHDDTPFGHYPTGSVELTLKLYSIFRLMFPDVLLPSTTALNTIHPEGRLLGIKAGANVVMPNISPVNVRDSYSLYNGKANKGAEAVEGIALLEKQLASIGYHIDWGRGDYIKN